VLYALFIITRINDRGIDAGLRLLLIVVLLMGLSGCSLGIIEYSAALPRGEEPADLCHRSV
jgi:hypothetical protein